MNTRLPWNRLRLPTILAALIVSQAPPGTSLLAADPSLLQIAQQAYLKGSNNDPYDYFGNSLAVSGQTVVVGVFQEDSDGRGVNGNQNNNNAPEAGAVYVFVRVGTNWSQQACLKASNSDARDFFGYSVAISGDTLAVGAQGEASSAVVVNGNQNDNSAPSSGAAYVFVRNGTNWTQQAYLKASNAEAQDGFGSAIAVAGDTVVVGAPGEASNATGVNANQSDNSAPLAGAAYVFVRSGTNWRQQAYLKASNSGAGDYFGYDNSVAISGDTLVVGAFGEASAATGVNGNQNDNGARSSGAAYVFARSGTTWTQQAYLKASNSEGANPVDPFGDGFGSSVAVSGDTVVVGAPDEDSNATGVNGNQSSNLATNSGAAYVFVRSGTIWIQQAYLKASNTDGARAGTLPWGDGFGFAVAVSGDRIVVGAPGEASNAVGINGGQSDNTATNSGAAYLFLRSGTNWSQQAYLKASNTGGFACNGTFCDSDGFGSVLALSGDTLVVAALGEDSNATGVNGDQGNNSMTDTGAAYTFSIASVLLPELRLTVARNGATLQLSAAGTTNIQWRVESRDSLTGTNTWQPLTNITLGAGPVVVQRPLDATNHFYRGARIP